MPKVIIAEPSDRYDISSAKDFGDLKYLSEYSLKPFDLANTIKTLRDGLQKHEFDPKEDFVCLTGHTLVLGILLAILGNDYETVKILLFDARISNYQCRLFSVKNDRES